MSEIFSKILKDKNGKTLNVGSKYQQPEWGVEENGVIYPETALTVDADMGAALITSPLAQELKEGEVYIVNFNGVTYECADVAFTTDEGIMHTLGNAAAAGAPVPETDEPFVIVVYDANQAAELGFHAMVVELNGSTSFTLSITGDLIHTIPSKYVEGDDAFCTVDVTTSDETVTFGAEFTEIRTKILTGKQVYARVDNSRYYPVTSFVANRIAFGGVDNRRFGVEGITRTFEFFVLDKEGATHYESIALT